MAINLRDDYKNMIDSVEKYGGFYIGRYELSSSGTKKNQDILKYKNWYYLYAKCKSLGSDSVEARMIWGCQWDYVCKFINQYGDKVSLTDSRKYGNYYDSIAPANTGNYSSGNMKNSGSNDAWRANNIYDLAGNCFEWTQEANQYRAMRGGDRSRWGGEIKPVTDKGSAPPTDTYDNVTSRPVLYLK